MKMQKRGFVLVLSAVLCVSTLLTGCGHKKNDIDLSKYITTKTSGWDGYGKAEAEFDKKAFVKDWGDKIKPTNSGKEMMKSVGDKNAAEAFVESVIDSASFEVVPSSGLSNDEPVKSTMRNIDSKAAMNYFFVSFGTNSFTSSAVVRGLKKQKDINPFKGVSVRFSGENGHGTAEIIYPEIKSGSDDESNSGGFSNLFGFSSSGDTIPDASESDFTPANFFLYKSDGTEITNTGADSGLSNDDEVTLSIFDSASPSVDSKQKTMGTYMEKGWHPVQVKKAFKVDGLGQYMTHLIKFGSEGGSRLYSHVSDSLNNAWQEELSKASEYSPTPYTGSISNILLKGFALYTNPDAPDTMKNMLLIYYEADASATAPDGTSETQHITSRIQVNNAIATNDGGLQWNEDDITPTYSGSNAAVVSMLNNTLSLHTISDISQDASGLLTEASILPSTDSAWTLEKSF